MERAAEAVWGRLSPAGRSEIIEELVVVFQEVLDEIRTSDSYPPGSQGGDLYSPIDAAASSAPSRELAAAICFERTGLGLGMAGGTG